MAHFFGDDERDVFLGTINRDYMEGAGGDDFLRGDAANDRLLGGSGDDLLLPGRGADYVDGGQGIDRLSFFDDDVATGVSLNLGLRTVINDGFGFSDRIFSIEQVSGSQRADTLIGSNADNRLVGNGGADFLSGAGRNDVLGGGGGNDTLAGGRHNDRLIGGPGADTFLFTEDDLAVADPADIKKFADRIYDFKSIDIIDLTQIDAIAGGADDAFDFIGTDPFSGTAGELRTEFISNHVYVFGDTNGDGIADLSILFKDFAVITAGSFIL